VAAEIALQYMEATTIDLVLDKLNIHRCKSLTDLFGVEFGSDLGPIYSTLHADASQLAQSAGDPNRSVHAAMPGAPANLRSEDVTTRIACLESPNQPARIKIKWCFHRKTARQKFAYKRQSLKRS